MSDVAATVFTARAIHTFDDDRPHATAVAVRDGRIVAVGSTDEVVTALGGAHHDLDDRLAEHVVLPGLIDQHLHPLLGATTLATEVVATEEWVLPDRTFPAASSPQEYRERLRAAHERIADPDEWLLSWGYHVLWHGPLDRAALDAVSATRPIGIWQRSCHEWYLNSAAIERIGLTDDVLAAAGPSGELVDLERGHAWEGGFMDVVFPRVAGELVSEERIRFGLRQMAAYLHQHGVTAFNEPGIFWGVEPIELYEEILGADEVPLWSTFMINGRVQMVRGVAPDDLVADAERQYELMPADGKLALFRDHVKLFADGAIISQLMMMREPYLDAAGEPDPDHEGEWMMAPDQLRAAFRAYWMAGWQIHTHVNGDLGLEVLLDIVDECQRDHPRDDHRCVIVHFANSTEEQVERIARLGAIVSANPYYPVGFADRYGQHGLGPERADAMVRSASVVRHGIPLSFHSDLPMAPAQPLLLAACAVNRVTPSGRVAGPEHRIGVDAALRAVTIGAAYSWRLEDELGTITPGKRANFTVLDADPYEVDAADLGRIPVVGTVFAGRWHPVPVERRSPSLGVGDRRTEGERIGVLRGHGAGCSRSGCACDVARRLAVAYRAHRRAA